MDNDTREPLGTSRSQRARRPRPRDLEDDADRFEDALQAEMLRTGAIEQWT